ncbi:metallophosphoesterase [Pseudahrensia aquimaris]|uniref:Metallophosphoesterase n=1 Tax=Pseudahrensia aquimaris TaxID=744461 RepID=A0ABW3FCX3_9HYPH
MDDGNKHFEANHSSVPTEASQAHSKSNIRLLENRTCKIGGIRIIGCTLWTDYALYKNRCEDAMVAAEMFMNDHRMIKTYDAQGLPGQRIFLPHDALVRHRQSIEYLTTALAKPFEGPTIIVTHHAPHPNSVAPQYENDLLTAAFVSDLSGMIEKYQPDLWIHGHTHTPFDYQIGQTHIICNPLGYARERTGFVEDLVVEV